MALKDQFVSPNPILLDVFGNDLRESLEHATTIIPFHSSTAIIASVVHFLRARFAEENGMPWYWKEEGSSPPGTIIIESAFDEDTESKGQRPGIYTERLTTVENRIGLDKTADRALHTGNALLITHDRVQMQSYAVSQKKGESALLGDIAYTAIQEGFKELERMGWIRDVRNLRLNRTTVNRTDSESWETPVDFQVEVEKSWFRAPIGVQLREIVLTLRGGPEAQEMRMSKEDSDE